MIIDFSCTDETVYNADVCIIGAGAAGFSCAVSLLNSGLRVLVLEGGLSMFDERAADIHRGEIIQHPHHGIKTRERVVGGSTTTWGGQALPFMKEDFEKRNHVKSSGWPISLNVLEPYYRQAEAILGTDTTVPFYFRPWQNWQVKEPVFSPAVELLVTKWCKIPNFATQHSIKLEKSYSVDLLKNANVIELLPTESLDAVEALRIRSLTGKEGVVHARYIIAAGGALETIRLFLASKKFGNNGLGNKYGLVGRYFQDHVAAIVGQVLPKSRGWFHEIFDPFFKNSFKYLPRIKLNPLYAQRLNILHASAQIVFTEDDNEILGVAKKVMSTLKKKKIPDIRTLRALTKISKIPELATVVFRWQIQKRGSYPKVGPVWLEIHSEQEPVKESRVTLSSDLDRLGMPRLRLCWTLSNTEVRTIRTVAQLIKEEFVHADLGEVILEPWVEGLTDDPFRWLRDTNHQAGGLRMATRAEEGVVDTSCRVFGVDNLFVSSSAVFPTSSFSNPTMTTIALSIRIAEIVKGLASPR